MFVFVHEKKKAVEESSHNPRNVNAGRAGSHEAKTLRGITNKG